MVWWLAIFSKFQHDEASVLWRQTKLAARSRASTNCKRLDATPEPMSSIASRLSLSLSLSLAYFFRLTPLLHRPLHAQRGSDTRLTRSGHLLATIDTVLSSLSLSLFGVISRGSKRSSGYYFEEFRVSSASPLLFRSFQLLSAAQLIINAGNF